MKKILHIANWYPNKFNEIEAIFVKEQFDLFSKVTDSTLVHVEVREDKNKWFTLEKIKYSNKETGFYIHTKIKSFKVIELLTTFLLIKALRQSEYKKFDVLHFHLAYPLLTYYHLLKKIIKIPAVLTEHWSAFHYNFYMPKNTKKLNGIKNIFYNKLPLMTVSESLLNDIQQFSGTKNFRSAIIPNVIDYHVYHYKKFTPISQIPVFFSVNHWRKIKNPIPMLNAFATLKTKHIKFKLVIGGYGKYVKKMQACIDQNGLSDCVEFLGKMDKQQIAHHCQTSHAYLFSSTYETFSAVCAQALCCGCPIIGPPISSILEYAGNNDIVTLKTDDTDGWINALVYFIENSSKFSRQKIALKAQKYLSHEKIQQQYLSFLP